MANTIFDSARAMMLKKELDWENDDIVAYLIDAALYTVSTSHSVLSSVAAGARASGPLALTNKVVTSSGAADADDLQFPNVSGLALEAVILVKRVLTEEVIDEALSKLLLYIDQATGLPVTPNTGDIVIQWDATTNRVFRP